MTCNIKNLPEQVSARVIKMDGDTHLVNNLLAMGFRNNVFVKVIRRLFFGENVVLELGDEHIVIRKREATCLIVSTSS